jgi:hypothetical protein
MARQVGDRHVTVGGLSAELYPAACSSVVTPCRERGCAHDAYLD